MIIIIIDINNGVEYWVIDENELHTVGISSAFSMEPSN